MTLPVSGSINYNGEELNNPSIRTNLKRSPVLDESGRTIMYWRYVLHVETIITPNPGDPDTAGAMQNARVNLGIPGGRLTYKGRGFPDMDINAPGGFLRDVADGPIPQVLSFDPIGNTQACRLIWECVFHLAEFGGRIKTYTEAMLAFNYETTFDITLEGLTGIAYNGYWEIPQSRTSVADPKPKHTADDWRPTFFIVPPPGFQSERQSYTLSKNQRRMDFSVVHREIPTPLMEGTVRCNISHRIHTDMKMGAGQKMWTGTIGGSVTMMRGLPRATAYILFLKLVQRRLQTKTHLPANGIAFNLQEGKVEDAGRYITQSFTVTEELTSLTTHFELSYIYFRGKFSDVLKSNGMWQPMEKGYFAWQNSMLGGPNRARGWLGLKAPLDSAAIVDLGINQIGPAK